VNGVISLVAAKCAAVALKVKFTRSLTTGPEQEQLVRQLKVTRRQEIAIPTHAQLTVKEAGVIGAPAARIVIQEPKLRPILSHKMQ